jgi:hypothetical protein
MLAVDIFNDTMLLVGTDIEIAKRRFGIKKSTKPAAKVQPKKQETEDEVVVAEETKQEATEDNVVKVEFPITTTEVKTEETKATEEPKTTEETKVEEPKPIQVVKIVPDEDIVETVVNIVPDADEVKPDSDVVDSTESEEVTKPESVTTTNNASDDYIVVSVKDFEGNVNPVFIRKQDNQETVELIDTISSEETGDPVEIVVSSDDQNITEDATPSNEESATNEPVEETISEPTKVETLLSRRGLEPDEITTSIELISDEEAKEISEEISKLKIPFTLNRLPGRRVSVKFNSNDVFNGERIIDWHRSTEYNTIQVFYTTGGFNNTNYSNFVPLQETEIVLESLRVPLTYKKFHKVQKKYNISNNIFRYFSRQLMPEKYNWKKLQKTLERVFSNKGFNECRYRLDEYIDESNFTLISDESVISDYDIQSLLYGYPEPVKITVINGDPVF